MKLIKLSRPFATLFLAFLFSAAALFMSGCGQSEKSTDVEDVDAESKIVQRTGANDGDTSGSVVGSKEQITGSDNASQVEILRDLTLTARKFEGEHRFVDAANIWADVIQRLEAQFGTGSWQAANAKLARETAIQQNSFDPPQLAILDELTELQKQIRAASEQNEVEMAAMLAQKSLEKTVQLFGPAAAVTAKQRRLLAQLLLQTGDLNRSVFELESALESLQTYYQMPHPEIVTLHDQLGEISINTSQTDKAIRHLSAATRLAGEVWGDKSVQYAKRANELGVAYYRTGDLANAVNILRAAEVIRAQSLGTDSLEVAHSRHNIGTAFMEMRDHESAIQYLKAAYDTFAAKNLVNIRNQVSGKLSMAYMLAKQFHLAEPLLAEQTALMKEMHAANPEHADVAEVQYRYAISLCRQGKYQAAEPEIQESLELNEKLFGPNHSRTLLCYQAYTLLLEQTGREVVANQLRQRLQVARQSDDNSFIRR